MAVHPRVVLSGWYGAVNLGDELLLEVLARWVREAGGVPVAFAVHPEVPRERLAIDAVSYVDRASIERELALADCFVLGGGGLFQDYDPFAWGGLESFPASGAAIYAQHFELARSLGVRTLALAQGVGPLTAPLARATARDVFSQAGAVSVRDADSAALLRALGVERDVSVAADPAWTYPIDRRLAGDLRTRWALQERKLLAVVLRDWPFAPGWEAAFVRAFRGLLPATWSAVWLDFSRTPPDAEPGAEIARRMIAALGEDEEARHVIWDGTDAGEAASVIASCDACLAMRFHGVLLAASAGVPFAAIEYDAKVASLAHSLLLSEARRVALSALESRLPGAVRLLLAGADAVESAVVERLANDAHGHRDLLERTLAGRTGPGRPQQAHA